jgi:tetratricopeptide (TPR) repeat protein
LRLLEAKHELADMAGDLGRMLEGLDNCLEVVEMIDSSFLRIRHQSARGHLFAQLGANEVAEAEFGAEYVYAKRRGLRYRLFGAAGMLAILAIRRGDLEATADYLAQARAAETPDQRYIGVLHGLGSLLALARGDLDDALDEARKSEAALSVARPLHPYGLATLANALRARGELDEAMTQATRAMVILEELGMISEIEVDVQVAYVEALLAVGRREPAREALLRFKARFDQRCAGIDAPELRESFCVGVPANARLLELCSGAS